MADGQWGRAKSELEKIRPSLADVPAWADQVVRLDLDLAVCADRLGDPGGRIEALRRVTELRGEGTRVRQLLAESLAASGQTDQAVEEYQRLVAQDPASWPALARLILVRTLREPEGRRDWSAFDQALGQAEKAQPETVEIALLRAEGLAGRGQTDQAHDLLDQTREAHPDRVEVWVDEALVKLRLKDREGAVRLLDEGQAALGNRVEISLARLLVAMTDPDAAHRRQQVEALEAGVEGLGQADRRTLLMALASVQGQLGQDEEADRLLGRAAKENPNDLEIRLAQLDRALSGGEDKRIEQALGEVRRIEGQGGDQGAFGEARRLILKTKKGDTTSLAQARSILARLAARRPDWPPLVLARAEADDLAGERDKAVEGYLQAFNLGARGTQVCRRAAELLVSAGRFDEADHLVRALEERGPLSGDLRRLAGGLALQQHEEGRALETARKAVEGGSQDPQDYLWLARVLWATDHKNEVEPVLRQALALDPKAPAARLAMVEYLVAVKRKDEAVAALGEAADLLDKTAPMVLAVGYEQVGDGPRALDLANKALDARPEEPAILRDVAALRVRLGHADTAEPLLRRLMALGPKAPSESAWARRSLASLRAQGGDYQGCEEALAVLGPISRDSSLADRRVRALILAGQPGRPHREEAVRLLEEVVRQSSSGAVPETFLLARLLDEAGDWLGAQQYLLQVLEADPKNIQALAYYARALLKRDESGRARPYIDRLKQADAEGLVWAELEARALNGEGRGPEAAARIEAAVRDQAPAVTVQGAALLEELELLDAAEVMLRRLSEKPEGPGPLALARFLGRQGRLDEAIGLCDRVRSVADPMDLAATCEVLAQRAEATDTHRQQISRWLREAIQQHPDRPELLTRLGVLQDLQGLYDDSEKSYRRALAKNPQDTVALNNLAWLLALNKGGADRAREALSLIDRAIKQTGPHPELLDTQTVAYLAAQKGDRAVESIRQAVERAPSPPFYFHQTRAYQAVHDSRAAAAFRKATAAGLKAEDLHPLERDDYLRLAIELAGG
jgi:tetratricopeptide (TPR) repeat protein